VKYLIPISNRIPRLILDNLDYARDYLKIAFEAEGSPILNSLSHKRYIKLSRNVGVSHLFQSKLNYSIGHRIYAHKLRREYPRIFCRILRNPPDLLLGEYLLLNCLFGIKCSIKFENIRITKTGHRAGEISAKWVLYIYASEINKFIKEIGFITKRKGGILNKMKNMPSRRRQFFAFEIINLVANSGVFKTSDFAKEMSKLGYKSPRAYLHRYAENGLIENISHGVYKIISQPKALLDF
jgi:hypothetical protein